LKYNVVLEEIEFVDDKDVYLPSPLTLEEVIRRSKVITNMEAEDNVEEPGK
jgi:splicing factor 3A subunit 1